MESPAQKEDSVANPLIKAVALPERYIDFIPPCVAGFFLSPPFATQHWAVPV